MWQSMWMSIVINAIFALMNALIYSSGGKPFNLVALGFHLGLMACAVIEETLRRH